MPRRMMDGCCRGALAGWLVGWLLLLLRERLGFGENLQKQRRRAHRSDRLPATTG